MSNLLEFLFVKFKPALLPDASTPPASFKSAAEPLLKTPGVDGVYLGQHIEDPDLFIVIIRWASKAAHDAFISSSESTEWHANLRALLDAPPLQNRVHFEGNVDDVLGAPCTEICTAWGTDDGFLEERGAPFSVAVDKAGLDGFHAIGWGGFEQSPLDGADVITGPAVRLILGWDSKQAHMQHKGVGSAIDQNIDYITSGRKQFDMIHVNLTKL
ncbi:Fc.00g063640.m01.CDS01 [Cosmosporella sp. VM-42]